MLIHLKKFPLEKAILEKNNNNKRNSIIEMKKKIRIQKGWMEKESG